MVTGSKKNPDSRMKGFEMVDGVGLTSGWNEHAVLWPCRSAHYQDMSVLDARNPAEHLIRQPLKRWFQVLILGCRVGFCPCSAYGWIL